MVTRKSIRNALGALGLAAGAIVVGLLAHNSYITAATPMDGALSALFVAATAVAGIAGPAVALRLALSSLRFAKLWGALASALAAAALLATLGNSLGAIASHAERVHVAEARRNDEAALARVTAEHAALQFNPTSKAAVAEAREAMLAAETKRIEECGGRGAHCQEFAAAVAAKRDAFAAVLKDRAAAERAETLDAEAAGIQARLNAAPAVRVQPQPAVVEQIFRAPEAGSVARPYVTKVAAIGLLIAFFLVGWVLLGARPSKTEVIHEAIRTVPVVTTKREPAGSGDLAIFVQDCMRPAGGETVELRMLYSRFLEWCDAQQLSPLPPKRFSEAFIKRCEEAHIDVRCEGTNVLCLDVRLAPVELWHR